MKTVTLSRPVGFLQPIASNPFQGPILSNHPALVLLPRWGRILPPAGCRAHSVDMAASALKHWMELSPPSPYSQLLLTLPHLFLCMARDLLWKEKRSWDRTEPVLWRVQIWLWGSWKPGLPFQPEHGSLPRFLTFSVGHLKELISTGLPIPRLPHHSSCSTWLFRSGNQQLVRLTWVSLSRPLIRLHGEAAHPNFHMTSLTILRTIDCKSLFQPGRTIGLSNERMGAALQEAHLCCLLEADNCAFSDCGRQFVEWVTACDLQSSAYFLFW